VTKPGNSDSADRAGEPEDTGTPADPTAEAGSTTEPTTEPTSEPTAEPVAEPKADAEAAPAAAAEPASPTVDAEAESKADPKTDAEADPDPEPLMTELEKAPPAPEESAPPAAKRASAEEPIMPTAAEAARRRSDLPRPKVLRIAFYLAIASAVVGLASAIQLFTLKQTITADQLAANKTGVTPAEMARAVESALWLYLIVVVVLGSFMVLFSYKAQDGVRRARMLLMIVTAVLVVFYLLSPFLTILGMLGWLLAVTMIVFPYLPSTRAYFGPRQTVR
jgi:hypothetical protein